MDAQTVGEEATQASGCGRGDACRKAAAARRREGVESDLGNRERERGSRQGAGEAAHRTNSSLSSQQMATGTRAKTTAEWRKPPGPHIIMSAWVRCMSWYANFEFRVRNSHCTRRRSSPCRPACRASASWPPCDTAASQRQGQQQQSRAFRRACGGFACCCPASCAAPLPVPAHLLPSPHSSPLLPSPSPSGQALPVLVLSQVDEDEAATSQTEHEAGSQAFHDVLYVDPTLRGRNPTGGF